MVALSSRFTFLAALSTLATLSLVPVSDAAVLHLRASDAASTKVEVAQTLPAPHGRTALADAHRFASRDAHKHVQIYDSPPVIPLPVPEIPVAPQKGKAGSDDSSGSSGSESDGKHLSDGSSHEEEDVPSGDKTKDAPHADTGFVSVKDKKAKGKVSITQYE
ncbi:hypothetical protein BJV78DRAFT_587279 [Lactifluus subvellereus]|nr:hypothetical protein BJV78DRAFT_587279 [Lactifluus subvellereus]